MHNNKSHNLLWGLCFLSLVLLSCDLSRNSNFLQRPRAYSKITLPPQTYKPCELSKLPYGFEISEHASAVRDTFSFFDIEQQNPNWININYPDYKATIYMSYIPIQGTSIYKRKLVNGKYVDSTAQNSFEQLLKNSYSLVYKHSGKASAIQDSFFSNKYGINGIFFTINGNTATKYQFFATDSVKHYLRGVLYFDATPNEDSLKPLNDYFVKDLKHMVSTIHWK